MKKLLLLSAMLLSCGIICLAQSLSASWNGKLTLGPQSLTIVLNIASDGSCTLDSPDQGAKDIPCATQYLSTDSIRIDIPAIGGSYSARLTDGKLVGNFVQMGYSFPLELVPGEAIPERPQTPTPPFGYETREVTFANAAAGVTLAGTLTLPQGCDHSTPVVLMVTGSGLQNRDEEIFSHHPFAVIADHLAQHGIASLRYDDRGFGQSTGDASRATTADFGDDAAAGIKYLKSLGQFGRIGVLGHSEGGMIAFRLAAHGDVDFAVALASPAMRGDSLLLGQNRLLLELGGTPRPIIDGYVRALSEVLAARIAPSRQQGSALAFADSVATAQGSNLPQAMVANLAEVLKESNVWLDYFLTCNPRADIAAAKCPVMAIGGSKDMQVPAENLEIIKSLLPTDERNMIKVYDGLNHLLQHCATGSPMEYNAITETISPEALQDMALWITTAAKQ